MYAQMRTFVFLTLVTTLACAVAQSLQEGPGERRDTSIKMLEVRRVDRRSTPYSQDHNVKIVLNQHQPLPTLNQWTLKIVREDGKQDPYTVQAQDPYQTEVEFEADLTNSTYIYIEGRDSDTMLVSSYTQLDNSFLSSRVARVGSEYNERTSSLRVWRGDMTEDVVIEQHRCQKVGTPCYYLLTTLPRDVPRCVTGYYSVKQCDDFITDFKKFDQSPEINITPNGMLTMQVILKSNPAKIEAVVFDPQNPSRIFSPENYECQLEVKQGVIHCRQQLKDIDNLQKFMVLLVSLNQEGFVLESTMELYGEDSGPSPKNSTGVIVGSVVGGVFGLALVIGAAVYVIKKKKGGSKKNTSNSGLSSGRYDAVSVRDHASGRMDA